MYMKSIWKLSNLVTALRSLLLRIMESENEKSEWLGREVRYTKRAKEFAREKNKLISLFENWVGQ